MWTIPGKMDSIILKLVLYSLSKEPYIPSKEPYIPSKQPYFSEYSIKRVLDSIKRALFYRASVSKRAEIRIIITLPVSGTMACVVMQGEWEEESKCASVGTCAREREGERERGREGETGGGGEGGR